MPDTEIDRRVSSFQQSLQVNSSIESVPLVLLRFTQAVDNRLPAEAAKQFAVDGVFCPPGKEIRGRDTLLAYYTTRLSDPRRTTRHIWSNIEYRLTGEGEAQLTAALMNYAFEPQVSETHLQLRVGTVNCRCVLESDGRWVFAEHLYVPGLSAHLPISLPIA